MSDSTHDPMRKPRDEGAPNDEPRDGESNDEPLEPPDIDRDSAVGYPDPAGAGFERLSEIRLRGRFGPRPPGGRGPGGPGTPPGLRMLAGGLAFVVLLIVILALVRRGPSNKPAPSESPPDGPATRSFTLYFLDPNGRLTAEAREVAAKASLAAQVHAVVAEELSGSMAGRQSAIPAGTELLHVFINRSGLATIDLSREMVRDHPGDMESEYATLAALVRIIRDNFPELTSVQILIEGDPVPTLAGHFAIDSPLLGEEWR